MKNILVLVTGLVLFFLILNFWPGKGIQVREQAIENEIKQVKESTVYPKSLLVESEPNTETTSAPTAVAEAAPTTPAPAPAAPVPSVDINTGLPAPATTIAPATPAPSETASAAQAPSTPPAPTETAAATPTAPPAPAPTPAAPAEPAPVAAVTPAPTPAPTPTPTPTPAPVIAPAPAPTAPVVAAVPAPPKVKSTTPKIIILGYYRFVEEGVANASINRISGDTFDKEMAWLRDNDFQVIPLSQLVDSLKTGAPLPNRAAVITINNGFSNAVTVAAPILTKYNYPWSFLVYTDFIEQAQRSVSWNDLHSLSKAGVEIGSQSRSHPYLADMGSKTPDEYYKWLNNELLGSRQALERALNKKVNVFAYPYGNLNDDVQAKAVAAGYDVLLGTSGDPVSAGDSPLHLGRLIINQFTSPYFETLLNEPAVHLVNAHPASGELITDPRPAISVTINYGGRIDPKSVHAELSTGGKFNPTYNATTHTLTFQPTKNLLEGPVFVLIKAKDRDTNAPLVAVWQFHFKGKAKAAQ